MIFSAQTNKIQCIFPVEMMCQTNFVCIYGSRETKPHCRIQFCGVASNVKMQVAYYATSRMMSLPSDIHANAIFMVPTKNLKYKYAGCRQNNAFNPDFENITFLHQVRIPILSNLPSLLLAMIFSRKVLPRLSRRKPVDNSISKVGRA